MPPDTACDVITLTNGKLIYCKIKSRNANKITYTGCVSKSDSIKEIDTHSVFMVTLPNGSSSIIATYVSGSSTRLKKVGDVPLLYFSLNSGISSPVGVYASTYYNVDPVYGGYASVGFQLNATAGIKLEDGLSFSVMGEYIHNGFDASSFLNENALTTNAFGAKAIGSYSYDHYAIFGGLDYDINPEEVVSFGGRILVGALFFNIPAITGAGFSNTNLTGSLFKVSLPAYHACYAAVDLGLYLKVHIVRGLRASLGLDYLLSPAQDGGGNTGPYSLNVAMFNSTLGIQYEIY
ncbi:MAG TPA: hypothetical protein VNZ45_12410 [Bacteroidia bacterium]|nr:hypothetical protein [Bacteroidia bacterium]